MGEVMSFKDILVALTTYPQPTPVSAVEEAVELAAALGGRISAIACEVKIKAPGSPVGNYLLDILGDGGRRSQEKRDQCRAAFGGLSEGGRENGGFSRKDSRALPDIRGPRGLHRVCSIARPDDRTGARGGLRRSMVR